jgi:outer membrane putative beta-barrel porin/alpha-amylase
MKIQCRFAPHRVGVSILGYLINLCLAIGGLSLFGIATALAEDEGTNNGEDVTRPINRFDVRLQYETLPDMDKFHEEFDNRDQETLTLRTDLVLFQKPDQIGLRVDLPIVWNNKPNTENRLGNTQSGLGDLLFQAIYAHTFDNRWAAGIGTRWMFPTATGDAFGDGKWQIAPLAGFRCFVPEVSKGTFAGMVLRWDNSFGGNPKRSNVQYLIIQPQFNLDLPSEWFLNSAPEIRSNYKSGKWFVPLDIMLGKKLGRHWVTSIEYRYGLIRGVDSYKNWIEARIGYFF